MSAQDKQVKISFAVDEASAGKAKKIIGELISEVQKLATATSKINFGGMGGGMGGGVTSFAGRPGLSAGTQANKNISLSGNALTGAVLNTANLFRSAASGSASAFKVMSDGLKRHVDDSDREIRRLEERLGRLGSAYEQLKKRAPGAFTSAGMSSLQSQSVMVAQEINRLKSGRSEMVAEYGEHQAGRGLPGFINRVQSGYQQYGLQGAAAGAMGVVGNPAGAGGFTGALLQAIGPGVVGAVGAAMKVAQFGLQTRFENRQANLDFNIDQPMMGANARAQLGQIFGGNALAIKKGDLARVMMMGRLANSPEMRAISGNHMDDLLDQKIKMATPTSMADRLMRGDGILSSAMDSARNWAGTKTADMLGSNVGDLSTSDPREIARRRAEIEMIPRKAQMAQDLLEAKMREDPEFVDRVNSRYAGAASTLSLARASGVSNSIRTIGKDRYGRPARMTGTDALTATAQAAGYGDASEMVGAMQEMGSTVGFGYKGRQGAALSLLDAKYGGLTNLAQLRAMGAQFGGGEYGAFEKSIQSRIGVGGMDITAGSRIAGLGADMMAGGNFSGNGIGLTSTLLDAGTTGLASGDMRMARAMPGGVESLISLLNGGIDPLQKALNMSAAMKAAPGSNVATKQALMSVDPATALDAVRNGKIPEALAVQGVSMDMLKKYVSATVGGSFARLGSDWGKGTDMGSEVAKFKAAGGLGYLAGKSKTEVNKAIKALAPALVRGGGAKNLEAAEASLRMMNIVRTGGSEGTGAGAHSAANMKTFEGLATKNNALTTVTTGITNALEDPEAQTGILNMGNAHDASNRERKNSQALVGKGSPSEAIAGVAAALNGFVAALQRDFKGTVAEKKIGAPVIGAP